MKRLLTSVAIGSLLVCALLIAQETKPAPATPIDAKKAELGGEPWDPAWDHIIEQAIPPEMISSRVPKDVRKFCPNFYNMSETDKRVFWAYFFQALAGAEACLDPTTRVRHPERQIVRLDPVTNRVFRSEGLLQLAYQDSQRYGCDFDWEKDRHLKGNDPSRTILQPKNNLECGVIILSNQLFQLKKPLLWKSSYWEPLRPGSASHRNFAKEMTNPPAGCAKPARPSKLKNVTTADIHEQAQEAKSTEQKASTQALAQ
jgi:hypothetical protein